MTWLFLRSKAERNPNFIRTGTLSEQCKLSVFKDSTLHQLHSRLTDALLPHIHTFLVHQFWLFSRKLQLLAGPNSKLEISMRIISLDQLEISMSMYHTGEIYTWLFEVDVQRCTGAWELLECRRKKNSDKLTRYMLQIIMLFLCFST